MRSVVWLAACLSLCGVVAGCSLERTGLGDGDGGLDAGARDGAVDAGAGDGDGGLDAGARDGAVDAPPLCRPDSCSDMNPCTDDRCDPLRGCVFTPNTAPCDDGVLCNGADRCEGGSCSVHDGVDPCPGASVCDPESDTCVGCEGPADCPGPDVGDWSECTSDPVDPCALTGTRTRRITSYACVDHVCQAEVTTETDVCTRDTEGMPCGDRMEGPWGECTYVSVCAEIGRRARSVVVGVCSGGRCESVTTTEYDSAPCGRETDGMACRDPEPGRWSDCMYPSECAERGMRTRTVTMYTCAASSCTRTTTMETETCRREPEGMSCGGGETCTPYGACMPDPMAGQCSRTGVQTRTCTPRACASGVCTDGAPRTETRACTRNPTGDACVDITCGLCVCFPPSTDGTQTCTATMRTCVDTACTGLPTGTSTFSRSCRCS